jgi:hypothetical protein
VTPDLQPVRKRGRLGLDRGVVVLISIVVVIGLALIKPWGSDPQPVAVSGVDDASGRPGSGPASPTTPSTPRPTPTAEALSLAAVSAAFGSVRHDPSTALVMSVWRPDPIHVSFLDAAPPTTELGSECTGGALLGEGTDAIGLSLPEPKRPSHVTHVLLRRLFDGQRAVRVPVVSEQDDMSGVAVVRTDGFEWAPGHYALTVDIEGRSGTVAFCVGRMTRLVDYSLVTFVPDIVDGPAARATLLRQLAGK